MKRFELALYAGAVAYAPGETLLVPVPEDERPLAGDAGWIDWRLCGDISRRLVSGYISGSQRDAMLIPGRPPLSARRLLLLGAGPSEFLRGDPLRHLMVEAGRRLRALQSRSTLLALPGAIDLEQNAEGLLRGLLEGLTQQPECPSFRLVIPDAGGRAPALEAALSALLPHAHSRGLALELGWVTTKSPEAAAS